MNFLFGWLIGIPIALLVGIAVKILVVDGEMSLNTFMSILARSILMSWIYAIMVVGYAILSLIYKWD